MAIFCRYGMKIRYFEESIRQYLVDLQYSRLELYNLQMEYFDLLKNLEYDDFVRLVEEECRKKDEYKRIKEIEPPLYEFRLPPQNDKGVLRIPFSIEDDYNSILILDAKVKDWSEKKTKKKGKAK